MKNDQIILKKVYVCSNKCNKLSQNYPIIDVIAKIVAGVYKSAVILPKKPEKETMTFEIIKSLLIPIIMIGFGIFIKNTENVNYQNVKKWWKILVILGVISLILKIVNLYV